ncbi:alpha/beta fold hydrolase [Opitutus terrae]|nr:alpha/beta fold hydrolase [Opitutus terrae]
MKTRPDCAGSLVAPGMNLDQLEHLTLQGAQGIALHAAAIGRGPLMLFLHGFPECWCAWHRQLPLFGRMFRAVALDLRGYNLSDMPPNRADYALPLIVDDVRRVIRALSPDRPAVIVGHDWGGIAGWVLARESPELIERMVIINAPHPAVFRRELKRSLRQVLASSYAGFFQLRGVAEVVLRAFNFAALRAMVYRTSAKPDMFPAELRRAYLDTWRRPGWLTAGLNYYRNPSALTKEAAASGQARIAVPTLVLWGDRDPALRPSNLEGLGSFVAHLTLHRHPAATHWIVHEEPDWVNAAIGDFITTVQP